MSLDAERAAWALVPHLERLLAVVPANHRPSPDRAAVVLLRIGWAHRGTRGDVEDETVDQLTTATGYGDGAMRDTLQAFDRVGLTEVVRHGGRGHGTVRRLRFLDPEVLSELRGADPAEMGRQLRGVDHRTARDDGLNCAGWTTELRGADPATPTHNPYVEPSPHPSDGGDEVQLRRGEPGWARELPEALRLLARITHDSDYDEGDVHNPSRWTAKWWRTRRMALTEAAVRWQPGMAAVLLDATAAVEAISDRDVGGLIVVLEEGCVDCDPSLFGRALGERR